MFHDRSQGKSIETLKDIVLSVFVKLALLLYFRTTGLTYGADKIHKRPERRHLTLTENIVPGINHTPSHTTHQPYHSHHNNRHLQPSHTPATITTTTPTTPTLHQPSPATSNHNRDYPALR